MTIPSQIVSFFGTQGLTSETLYMNLFTNDATIGAGTVSGSLTVASGGGYAQKTIAGTSWTGTVAISQHCTLSLPEQTFTFTGSVGVIYGWAITEGAGLTGDLVAVGKFNQGQMIGDNGDTIAITVAGDIQIGSPITDSFTRADENPITTYWTTLNMGGTWVKLASNQITSNNGTWGGWAWRDNESYNANQSSQFRLNTTPTTPCGGPAVRVSGTDENPYGYYMNVRSTSAIRVWCVYDVNETGEQVGTDIAGTFASGDIFKLSITGYVLSVYQNGNLLDTRTDTNTRVATGAPGIVNDNVAIWDDWVGGGVI